MEQSVVFKQRIIAHGQWLIVPIQYLSKASIKEFFFTYNKSIREWFTSLAYLEEKHIRIWCEKGELFLVFTSSTSLRGQL
jgi:hypothetical protein